MVLAVAGWRGYAAQGALLVFVAFQEQVQHRVRKGDVIGLVVGEDEDFFIIRPYSDTSLNRRRGDP